MWLLNNQPLEDAQVLKQFQWTFRPHQTYDGSSVQPKRITAAFSGHDGLDILALFQLGS